MRSAPATGKVHVAVALKEGQGGSGIGGPCANLVNIGTYGAWSVHADRRVALATS
jgi:hypothetical protein